MVAANLLMMIAGVVGANETVLLDFSTQGCRPCMQMRPIIARLKSEGCAVREVSFNSEPQIARQFHVNSFPTMVLLHKGKEIARRVGYTSYSELIGLYDSIPQPRVIAPPKAIVSPTTPPVQSANLNNQLSNVSSTISSPEALARRATVRLTVEDATGRSYATGTIIDVHNGEALIGTCGHTFRPSRGQGKITVDFHTTPSSTPAQGVLIAYKAEKRDIAFVSVRLPTPIQPIQVARRIDLLQPGLKAFSLGCDHGAPATVRPTKIVSINRYTGPANVEIQGAPTQGRSGGGLFTSDGKLIGICNAADNASDEGIYASLPIIQEELAAIGQRRLFEDEPQRIAPNTDPSRQIFNASTSGAAPKVQPIGTHVASPIPVTGQRTTSPITISIRGANGGQPLIISNPSPLLLAQLRREYEQQNQQSQQR